MAQQDAKPRRPARPELAPGTTFAGRYRVVHRLGAGGMADVYEVEHTITRRHLALKVLRPEALANPVNAERFFREASVCSGIDSDHIVAITDCDVDPATESPFLVMELLQGRDLAAYVRETHGAGAPIPTTLVLTMLRQVASALDKVHAQGIVHRDLKPANLFLSFPSDGPPRVKILDFGIAKHLAEDGSNSTGRLGTPLYMAAEQLHGDREVGPATDVWALGLIAYELLVGKAYWEGHTAAQLVNRLPDRAARHLPSVLASRHGVTLPPSFDRWLLRCIDPDAKRRFPSAGAAVGELIRIFDPGATHPPVAPSAPPTLAPLALVDAPASPLPPRASLPPPPDDVALARGSNRPPKTIPPTSGPPARSAESETNPGRPRAKSSLPPPPEPPMEDDDPTRSDLFQDDVPTRITTAPPPDVIDDDAPASPPSSLPPRTATSGAHAIPPPPMPRPAPSLPSLPPAPAPAPAPVASPEPHEHGVRPLTIGLTGLVATALVASAAYVVVRDRAPPAPPVAAPAAPPDPLWRGAAGDERASLAAACRAWTGALAARQNADGSFAGVATAPSSGWDTGQQLAALLHAGRTCAAVAPEAQLRALTALDQFRLHAGWAGAPADRREVRPSTVASAWATLAYAVLEDVTRDPNARTRAVTARDTLLGAQPAGGDGAFAFGLGPAATPEPSAYATVMALWALVETEHLAPAPRAVGARQSALAWLRRALASEPAGVGSLRATPGLLEHATWVLWRARTKLHATAPDDAALAAQLAREILARCAPPGAPSTVGACARSRDEDAVVRLRGTAAGEPAAVAVVWLPWTTLAAAALARDEAAALPPETRRALSAVVRWGVGQFELARPAAAVAPSYKLADYLFAAAELQR